MAHLQCPQCSFTNTRETKTSSDGRRILRIWECGTCEIQFPSKEIANLDGLVEVRRGDGNLEKFDKAILRASIEKSLQASTSGAPKYIVPIGQIEDIVDEVLLGLSTLIVKEGRGGENKKPFVHNWEIVNEALNVLKGKTDKGYICYALEHLGFNDPEGKAWVEK